MATVIGTHHGVSPQHLQAYLNEHVFRFRARSYATYGNIVAVLAKPGGLFEKSGELLPRHGARGTGMPGCGFFKFDLDGSQFEGGCLGDRVHLDALMGAITKTPRVVRCWCGGEPLRA